MAGWTEQAAPYLEQLDEATGHPVAGHVITPTLVRQLVALWDHRELVLAALDELPVTLAHQDVFTRNVAVLDQAGNDRVVAFDWAYVGPAPVGQELAALVGASQTFLACPTEDWDAVEATCLHSYVEGLRAAGWDGTVEEVRRGYLYSVPLRYALGALPPILYTTTAPDGPAAVPGIFGCSYEEFLANEAAFLRFQADRIEELRADLGF